MNSDELELFDNQLDIKNDKVNLIKNMIENRYRRIQKGRRPSCEYINSVDIQKIFLEYVENKNDLLSMTDIELQSLYDRWYTEFTESQR